MPHVIQVSNAGDQADTLFLARGLHHFRDIIGVMQRLKDQAGILVSYNVGLPRELNWFITPKTMVYGT